MESATGATTQAVKRIFFTAWSSDARKNGKSRMGRLLQPTARLRRRPETTRFLSGSIRKRR